MRQFHERGIVFIQLRRRFCALFDLACVRDNLHPFKYKGIVSHNSPEGLQYAMQTSLSTTHIESQEKAATRAARANTALHRQQDEDGSISDDLSHLTRA